MPARSFSRHWPHPEALSATTGLSPARAVAGLRRAVRRGDPEEVRGWMSKVQGPRAAFIALQRAFPAAGELPGRRFDESAVATSDSGDPTAGYTVYARRVGPVFLYRVYDWAAGRWTRDTRALRPLPRRSLAGLIPAPSAGRRSRRPAPQLSPARIGRDFSGWGERIDEVEREYKGTDYGDHAPCPLCGADPYGPGGNRCGHLMLLWEPGENLSEWGGDCRVPSGFLAAVQTLAYAAGDLSEAARRRLARGLSPTALRRVVLEILVAGRSESAAVAAYTTEIVKGSPTYAGAAVMSVVGPPGGYWTVHWDSAAAAYGRQVDRRLRRDTQTVRRLILALGGRSPRGDSAPPCGDGPS